MAKFKVHGYAMCPCEVEIFVDAENEQTAMNLAMDNFRKYDRKGDFVVIGSEDPSHPEQWFPSKIEKVV